MKIQILNDNLLANTDEEYINLLASDADWLIRTSDDLDSLRNTNVAPFAKLTQETFDEFVNTIKFSQGGLGHACYKPLMTELSLTEIFSVFSYFGLSPVKVLDYADKKCASAGTCSSSLFDVCTSTC
jgi:hypothetical protein